MAFMAAFPLQTVLGEDRHCCSSTHGDQPGLPVRVLASDRRARPAKLPAGQISKFASSPVCKNISVLA
jgi:hypothetical protein